MARRPEDIGLDRILQAARCRFLQWGYSGTTIAALADDLGMTKAALYYHFADKEALFLAVVGSYLDELSAELGPLEALFAAADRDAALAALAGVFLPRNQTNAEIQHLVFQESPQLSETGRAGLGQRYHQAMVRPVSSLLSKAVSRGWLRPSQADEPQAIWIFLGLLSAFIRPGHAGKAIDDTNQNGAFIGLLLGALGARA